MLKQIISCIFLVYCCQNGVNCDYTRGCYYTNWAQYRTGIGQYFPSKYQAGLCSHIFYAFASMTTDYKINPFEWNDLNTSWSQGMYSQVLDWKQQQPDLKILLSFGGWNFCQGNPNLLESMAASSANRQTFIQSVLQLINLYKFDGFDIDWEYPSVKTDYSSLLRDLRTAFDQNVPRLILTMAGAANPEQIDISYEVSTIANYLDMLNVMTYDFHGSWEMVTGQNSPLYDRNSDRFSISDAVAKYRSEGFPANKLNVGLAAYGRGWTLQSASNNGVGAPAIGPSPAQPYTKEAGTISYYEVCSIIDQGAQQTFDDCQESPDAILNTQWYSYDNVDSFNIKLNWMKDNGLMGVFVWTLDFDDFNGICTSSHGQKYPLIETVNQNLLGYTVQPVSKSTTRAGRLTTVAERTTNSGKKIAKSIYTSIYIIYISFDCDQSQRTS